MITVYDEAGHQLAAGSNIVELSFVMPQSKVIVRAEFMPLPADGQIAEIALPDNYNGLHSSGQPEAVFHNNYEKGGIYLRELGSLGELLRRPSDPHRPGMIGSGYAFGGWYR